MGKWNHVDIDMGDYRILCWEDDYMPFDFCFIVREKDDKSQVVGYVDVYDGHLLDRLDYLRHKMKRDIITRLDRYTELKGGIIAWDSSLEDSGIKDLVYRIMSVLHVEKTYLLSGMTFENFCYKDISLSLGRISISGRALDVNEIYLEDDKIEKVISLASLTFSRITNYDEKSYRIKLEYPEYPNKWRINYVFIADMIDDFLWDEKNYILKMKGFKTSFILKFPKSWFKLKFCDFRIEDWEGYVISMKSLSEKYFIKHGIFIIDNITYEACYEEYDKMLKIARRETKRTSKL